MQTSTTDLTKDYDLASFSRIKCLTTSAQTSEKPSTPNQAAAVNSHTIPATNQQTVLEETMPTLAANQKSASIGEIKPVPGGTLGVIGKKLAKKGLTQSSIQVIRLISR